MKLRTVRRIADLATHLTPALGCASCQEWPSLWIIIDGDPEPPVACAGCGRNLSDARRIHLEMRRDGAP